MYDIYFKSMSTDVMCDNFSYKKYLPRYWYDAQGDILSLCILWQRHQSVGRHQHLVTSDSHPCQDIYSSMVLITCHLCIYEVGVGYVSGYCNIGCVKALWKVILVGKKNVSRFLHSLPECDIFFFFSVKHHLLFLRLSRHPFCVRHPLLRS